MSGSVNKVILIGNLGRDPEVRHTQAGAIIVNLSVATSESWRDKATGEKKERVEWNRVVLFNEKIAEVAQKYLTKGAKVYIEGTLQTRKWTDQSGVEKYTTEVVVPRFGGALVMLETQRREPGPDDHTEGERAYGGDSDAAPPARSDTDDDIPY